MCEYETVTVPDPVWPVKCCGDPPRVIPLQKLGPDWDRALARAGCVFALETMQGEWSTVK